MFFYDIDLVLKIQSFNVLKRQTKRNLLVKDQSAYKQKGDKKVSINYPLIF